MKPKDIDIGVVPTVGGVKPTKSRGAQLADSIGKAFVDKIENFQLKHKQEDLQNKKDKARNKRFIQVMTDLASVKRETLKNQVKIIELQHKLDMKKVESRHGNARLNQTLVVIFWLSLLLAASLYLGLQPLPQVGDAI